MGTLLKSHFPDVNQGPTLSAGLSQPALLTSPCVWSKNGSLVDWFCFAFLISVLLAFQGLMTLERGVSFPYNRRVSSVLSKGGT